MPRSLLDPKDMDPTCKALVEALMWPLYVHEVIDALKPLLNGLVAGL